MRDFLPADVRKREYVIGVIKEVYESYGFEPLETPAVENLETLTGKYGEEGSQLIFKILKRGEKLDPNFEITPFIRKALEASATMSIYVKNLITATVDAFNAGEITKEDFKAITEITGLFVDAISAYRETSLADLALRYDLTVPLARVVANYKNDLPKFFKRYQIQPVWRADRPARGRYREFYQCDVDTIGSKSILVEVEQISAVCEILQRLGFEDFTIRINNRKLLTEILNQVGISPLKHTDALMAIDKLDKIGIDGVLNELDERGVEADKGEELIKFFRVTSELLNRFQTIFTTTDSIISAFTKEKKNSIESTTPMINEAFVAEFSKFFKTSEPIYSGLIEIDQILSLMSDGNGIGAKRVVVDPSLARGLSYYTGAIFEVRLESGDFAGSLGGGGRYDGLIGMFGKEEIPACGFSLGLERILVVMEERGMFPPEIAESKAADVMVTIWNEDSTGESLKLASELREQGLRVLVYPEADKLGKQFKYADSINIPFVCVIGETELAAQQVTLKNMHTGGQETLSREEAASKISAEARTK